MATINSQGYVQVRGNGRNTKRSWFLVKHMGTNKGVGIKLNNVLLPKHLTGRRIRLKVEINSDYDNRLTDEPET